MDNSDFEISVNGNGSLQLAAGTNYNDVNTATSMPSAVNGSRHTLGLTFDGQTLKSYFDASNIASASRLTGTTTAAGTLRIGTRDDAYWQHFVGDMSYVIVYNRTLSAVEIAHNQTARDITLIDCNDASASSHPLNTWYKDVDADGYSDGVTVQQCAQPTNYKLATALTATTGDCNDADDLLNPATIWYSDDDGDSFADGVSQVQCTDPGATRYLPSQLIGTANTAYSLNLTSGLVGHWSFDSNDGDDESGNGNTGTAISTPVYNAGKL
jgi:hypothetical protein